MKRHTEFLKSFLLSGRTIISGNTRRDGETLCVNYLQSSIASLEITTLIFKIYLHKRTPEECQSKLFYGFSSLGHFAKKI